DCDFSGIINVGTGVATSNQEVVKLLEDIAGKKVKTRKAPSDRFLWVADNSKIKSLGWKPEVLLGEGLKRVYETKNT
ncbi:MAG: GDP-L-fucose synthase, partial [Patescibacteria group bacterium]